MHYQFIHFTGNVFGFNLGIDSTKYLLLSGYVTAIKNQFVTLDRRNNLDVLLASSTVA